MREPTGPRSHYCPNPHPHPAHTVTLPATYHLDPVDQRVECLGQPTAGTSGPVGKVVTVCTSMRFLSEAHREGARLTAVGHTVLMPFPAQDVSSLRLKATHVELMHLSEAVHVVCPGGYVGESVRGEIKAAHALGLPVTYSEAPRDHALPNGPGAPRRRGWIMEEFERASARSAQIPAWAKPVVTKSSDQSETTEGL